jgi:excisionase family DNA binding protein
MTAAQRNPQTETDILTIRDVAARLGVSTRTIHRWVDAGRIKPSFKGPGIRGLLLFARADVEAMAESDGLR